MTPVLPTGDSSPGPWSSETSVWQEVESGSYRIDLPFWAEVSLGANTPVLDLGCGTGRVARHLARAGHRVTGIELDPGVAADFRRMSIGLPAEVLAGDVLELDRLFPGPRQFDRILLPQQLIQILGGETARASLMAAVNRLLTPDGVAAFALVPELPESSMELDISPDQLSVAGWSYSSRPVSIEAATGHIELTRIRERTSPSGLVSEGASVITFSRIDPERFRREAERSGLHVHDSIGIPATDQHTGSMVVLCRSGGL